MLAAGFSREWRSRGSAVASSNFMLGIFAMVGVLVFLGCPWRALLRTGAGDLNDRTDKKLLFVATAFRDREFCGVA
jgi:hypothetical protein